jgi:divalent metal cation (Fe/Co/Zn/Cd) transporter
VQRGHELSDKVEEAVRNALPGTSVTVHIEPVEEPSSWADSELIAVEKPFQTTE